MTHDSDERQKPARNDGEPETQTFGWHPDVPEPTRIEQRRSDLEQDAQPSTFTGPSLIGEPSLEGPAYWTPARPGELPPTIIRRKAPASAREMLGRYSKPAMMALTVAAVSSAGLWQSAQTAIAQAANSADSDDGSASNVRPAEAEEQPETYQLQNENFTEGDDQATRNTTTNARTEPFIYTVETGDWVRHIARDFGLQTMTVVWNNDLPDPDYILPGQELLILPVDGVMIEVQQGETLNSLATMFGVSTTAIINYEPNGITDPDLIRPGQILIIPGGVPPQAVTQQFSGTSADAGSATSTGQTSQPAAQTEESAPEVQETEVASFSSAGATITVSPGDTLASIAESHGTSVSALLDVNDLADVDSIFPGDSLYLPAGIEPQTVTVVETEPEPEIEGNTAPEPDPTPAPEPEPEPGPAPEPTPAPEPDPTPTPEPPPPAPEPTATPQPEPTPTPAPPPADTSPPSDIPGLLEYHANQYGLDPNLIKAVAWRESGWNQSAVSSAGAIGVMQVMPGTATWINNNLVSRNLDVRGSAADNIEAGTAYLAHRIAQFGDVEHGLAAYFMGPATVQNYGITETGRQYVNRIFEIRDYIAANGSPPSWR